MKLSYKSVLDRHVRGETNKKVAESLQTTRKTVKRIIEKAEKLRLLPDAYLNYEEDDLKAKMNPQEQVKEELPSCRLGESPPRADKMGVEMLRFKPHHHGSPLRRVHR